MFPAASPALVQKNQKPTQVHAGPTWEKKPWCSESIMKKWTEYYLTKHNNVKKLDNRN